MNPQIVRIIDRYLTGELSAEETIEFGKKLAQNIELQQEVALYRQIMEASKRAGQRQRVKQAGKRYHLRKKLINSVVVVAVALTVVAIVVMSRKHKQETEPAADPIIEAVLKKLDDKLFFPNLAVDRKMLNAADTVVFMSDGTMLSIPDNAFLLNEQPYNGQKTVEYQAAKNASDIMKSGLSTTSDGKLLETGGMFSLNAYTTDGQKLKLNPKVGVYVEFPVNGPIKDIQLFEGQQQRDGIVNWINPKSLERKPVAASMSDLNFYPPGYEAKLNELKWEKGRQQRDSLYLSFEEIVDSTVAQSEATSTEPNKFVKMPAVAESAIQSRQSVRNDATIGNLSVSRTSSTTAIISFDIRIPQEYALYADLSEIPTSSNLKAMAVNRIWPRNGSFNSDGTLYSNLSLGNKREFVRDNGGVFRLAQKIRFSRKATNIQFNIELYPCNDQGIQPVSFGPYELALVDDGRPFPSPVHIRPSKVLAFWDSKFNNTILATRDFEKRMAAIHKTCSPLVLDAYLNNLGRELWKTDEQVAKMGYPEFAAFANERVGKIDLTDGHQQNLKRFFTARLEEIREKAKNDKDFARQLEEAYNKQLNAIRNDQSLRDAQRRNQNYGEEWELNYTDCLCQLGRERPKVGFLLTSGAPVYNLDKFASGRTILRTSGKFHDKETGKTAEINYDPLSLEIADANNYQKLFVYLLSDKLHSFERLSILDGKVSYNLNRLMTYQAVVVGMNENGWFLKQLGTASPGDIGSIALVKISEEQLDKILNGLDANRLDTPTYGNSEIEWLQAEQKDFAVQRLWLEQAKFRGTLRPIVYPCMTGTEYAPVVVAADSGQQ